MPISAGTRLGPYEIVASLGAGGMGEVYRARDARLGRDVALKVLPEVFAKDAERMARFEREAQVLASLNHPNIAALYGLEESGGVRALVMELVEGPTLAERIEDGPIPIDEALPIARQIAEALEAAHEKGIIHRDLKPSNVKVKADGAVKVLDFGLAKALEDDPASSDVRNSPTLSLAATRAGVILGTAAYMPPEQAKGKPVDRRADIWAFGVVLFEMLTGQQLFAGETAGDTLAAVIKDEPKWDRLPESTPPAIRKLLRRCLDRDPRRRLRDIGEARLVIEDVMAGAPAEEPSPRPRVSASPRLAVSWVVAGALLISTLVLAFLYFGETPPAERVMRYSVPAPEKASIHSFAISPDGRYLAIAATAQGKRYLWVRALDALQPQLLPGTEEAANPFWSPDSRWIGFFAQGKLKKIAVSGGPAQTLCDAAAGRGGAWNRDGVILFAPSPTGPLFRVSAVGGVPVQVAKAEGGGTHRNPVFLPDGRRFLYQVTGGTADKAGVHVASLDGVAPRRVLADISNVAYAPPAARGANLLTCSWSAKTP
ncbi:MAG: serine/threonine-protein kinase [Acidobacteria bacterium]|nr:serine/threonine-protein kinase [Acidobacteriota bacterium]